MFTLKIDEILEKKGKTRYWLSKQCGVAQNNFAKICNNETISIKFDILEKICAALECTPNDILVSDDPTVSRLISYAVEFNSLNKKGDSE